MPWIGRIFYLFFFYITKNILCHLFEYPTYGSEIKRLALRSQLKRDFREFNLLTTNLKNTIQFNIVKNGI